MLKLACRIPLYGEVRVAVLIWLVLPQTKVRMNCWLTGLGELMHDISLLLAQGATWMYEAIVGPLFSTILNEAVKIPAIDRMVHQTESV